MLLSLLLFCLSREHDNLYLALFKVRRLHERDSDNGDGESAANYLYHALAMSQVLSSPPTRARWQKSRAKNLILRLLYLVPLMVQTYIAIINTDSLDIARILGAGSALVMLPVYLSVLITGLLGVLAIRYAQACERRWRSAFFRINPSIERVEPSVAAR